MTDTPLETTPTWKSLSPAERVSVLRLAQAGERHPDERVAAAAASWAHDPSWGRVWNRAPGWLLPVLGLLIGVLVIALGYPLLAILAALVVVAGLLGWNSTRAAGLVRAAYKTQRSV